MLALTTLVPATIVPANASSERSLYVHYTHTNETEHVVFKRNGRYVQAGLDRLNHLTRDWRRDEATRMDPALWDLVWEVYQQANTNQPIHIVSGYRAPATNAMLASNSSGVASNSQHMSGKALDFYIPGVPAARLRELGFRIQGGGVGYYPSSGNPFVHLDTGSVRAWPRMTTAQLKNIFPDGRTMHIPSNGVPLSQEGYQLAKADFQRCNRVPCGGASSSGSTQVAQNTERRTLMDLFTGGGSSSEQPAQQPTAVASAPAPTPAPAPQPQQSAAPAPEPAASQPEPTQVADAPLPPTRPGAIPDQGGTTAVAQTPPDMPFEVVDAQQVTQQVAALADDPNAPVPPAMSDSIAQLRNGASSAYASENAGTLAIAALEQSPVPLRRPEFEAPIIASAYAASTATSPGIATDSDAPAPTPTPRPQIVADTPSGALSHVIETAALGDDGGLEGFAALFNGPILPRDGVADPATTNALSTLSARPGEFYAPDLDHVTEMFLTSALLSSDQFAYMLEPDNADFDPATTLGDQSRQFAFGHTASLANGATGFAGNETILVTLR